MGKTNLSDGMMRVNTSEGELERMPAGIRLADGGSNVVVIYGNRRDRLTAMLRICGAIRREDDLFDFGFHASASCLPEDDWETFQYRSKVLDFPEHCDARARIFRQTNAPVMAGVGKSIYVCGTLDQRNCARVMLSVME